MLTVEQKIRRAVVIFARNVQDGADPFDAMTAVREYFRSGRPRKWKLSNRGRMAVNYAIRAVCDRMGVPVAWVRRADGRKSHRAVSDARAVCCIVLRERFKMSTPEIARSLLMRNHTSVLNLLKRIRTRPDLLEIANQIEVEGAEHGDSKVS